jgi:hypothetical protein
MKNLGVMKGLARNSAVPSQPCPSGSYNTGYTAYSVRSNRLSPTSHSPNTLYEIACISRDEQRGRYKMLCALMNSKTKV